MPPVITRVPEGALWLVGGMGIAAKYTKAQVVARPSADCAILSNFLSLSEIQSTQMELISPNPQNDEG